MRAIQCFTRAVSLESVSGTSTRRSFIFPVRLKPCIHQVSRQRRQYASPEEPSSIEPPDVRKLAKLAQIHVTDEEVSDWEPKLKEIVGWFNQLQRIDVEGVPPCTHPNLTGMLASGKDEPVDFDNREAMMNEVPEKEGAFVKVPKIM